MVNMSNKESLSVNQFNKWAATYDSFLNKRYFNKTNSVIFTLISKSMFSLVDIGCGTGELLTHLSIKYPQAALYGVDISKGMLDVASKKLGNKASLTLASADTTNLPSNKFDYVVCSHSLHHHKNAKLSLKEFYRILYTGGTLILTDGVIDNYFQRLYFTIVNILQNEKYVYRSTSDSLIKLAQDIGFVLEMKLHPDIFNATFLFKKDTI